MNPAPLILLSPATQEQGAEFFDYSINLSDAYPAAIIAAGGIPVILPCPDPAAPMNIAEAVRRCDGVMLTGGEDVETARYRQNAPEALARTVGRTDPRRDELELALIAEVIRQKKPLLAICRGLQILNVALGGTLVIDIPSEVPATVGHNRPDRKDNFVHEAAVEKDSLLFEALGADKIQVNSTHHQAVGELAKPLRVVSRSQDGVVEAVELRLEDRNLLPYLVAVQFHPERLVRRDAVYLNLFRGFVRACASGMKQPV